MKLPYLGIKEAFDEAKNSFSYGTGTDKVAATAKLLGKSVANVGMFAIEAGTEALKRAPEYIGDTAKKRLENESNLMTDKQIEAAHRAIELGESSRERRLQQEREKAEKEKWS